MSSSRLIRLFAFAGLTLAGCAQFEGLRPDGSTLSDPVCIAVHPTGDYVYVVNSNFSADFDVAQGGYVSVIDAATLQLVPQEPWLFHSYGARMDVGGGTDPFAPTTLAVAVRGGSDAQFLTLEDGGARVTCPAGPERDACSVPIGRDPYAVTALPRAEGTPETTDTWLVGALEGTATLVSIENGDVGAATTAELFVQSGANILRWLDSTGEVLLGARFGTRVYTLSWFLTPEGEAGGVIPRRSLALPTPSSRSELRDVAFSSDRTRAWVTGQAPSSLHVLDITPDSRGFARNTMVARYDLDGAPADVVAVPEQGRDVLYIALADDEALAVVDGASGEFIERIPLSGLAFGLAADTQQYRRLYVTLFDEDAVAVIDIDPASPSFRSVIGVVR